MSSLAAYLLAAMAAWSPLALHHYAESESATEARYQAIAQAIADVALDPSEAPLFAGADGRVRTAVLLASIASLESGFRADIATCHTNGDHGRAWGLFQSEKSQRRACASVTSAAHLALEQIRQSFKACEQNDPDTWLAFYCAGSCGKGLWLARNRWRRAAEWMRAHPWRP